MSKTKRTIAEVNQKEITDIIKKHTHNLNTDPDPLFERIGDATIVLLGEASHGTHEYYIWRAVISRYLIENKGFNIIGVEGDWPDCYRINRYIRNYSDSGNTSPGVLKKFKRWPAWMWANWEIAAFMDWLREHNRNKAHNRQVGFYGLDVYSLWESLQTIREYLQKNDPDALKTAEKAIRCFEPYGEEGAEYATSTRFVPETCEEEVIELLAKIRNRAAFYNTDPEAPFNTEQNAIAAVHAERYYRAMIAGGPESWNIRDRHMTETLERLVQSGRPDSKAIVWEHNTHIGDARATDMRHGGMVNVGQLAREMWGEENVVAVGFGSYKGSVIAGKSWGARMREMEVPPAREKSWEDLLHGAGPADKLIITDDLKEYPSLSTHIDHRAIGVVYHPERERFGNYVPSIIPKRYDAFIHIDETRALHPIEARTEESMVPETYPWSI